MDFNDLPPVKGQARLPKAYDGQSIVLVHSLDSVTASKKTDPRHSGMGAVLLNIRERDGN